MPRRSSISQIVQIGVETTIGTSVAANRKLPDLMLTPRPMANVLRFRGSASKYASVVSLGKEWSEAAVTGSPGYNSIIYPLNSIVNTGVITTPATGTNSRDHTFTPNVATEDTIKSYTVEKGSTAAAEKTTGNIFNELAINVNRNECALTGTTFGQLWQTGVTMTGSPTTIAMVPIMPKQFDIYSDSTFGGLGATKLTADFVANFTIGNRFGQIWPINSAKTSWDEPVETEPQVRMAIQVENNTAGQQWVTDMRNSTTRYVRLEALGAIIETTITYKLRIDMVAKVIEAPDVADADGLYVLNVLLEAFDDGTNPPYRIVATNTITAL
jgi:hypothetical protein